MAEVIYVASKDHLKDRIRDKWGYETSDLEDMTVNAYPDEENCLDGRIGWRTYMVYASKTGVLGFTNGPL